MLVRFLLFTLLAPRAFAVEPGGVEFFEQHVRPVLVEHCYECHGEEKQKGGLRLDSHAGWQKGGESGPALVPGKPEDSLLIKAVQRLDKDLAMPPKKELPASAVQDLIAWVKHGAPDPRTGDAETQSAKAAPTIDYAAERKKWAFRAPEKPPVPAARDGFRVQNEIDAFIAARAPSQAPPADARTLLRRLSFDLTGLPPTPVETDWFELAHRRDPQAAVAQLVDSLLASPHYGEKWGRHWLDVVRYADSIDSRGMGKEGDIMDAWRYRDWVVNAFNRDLPYDQFITHQIAGDLVAARAWDAEKVIATGMYAIGNWGNGDSDKQKVYTDIVDDQIDVTGRAFLGLTLSCARCHDHKFDPITAADYYGLAGFFFSSHILAKFSPPTDGEKLMRIALLSPEEKMQRETLQRQLAAIDAQLTSGLRPLTEEKRDVLSKAGLHARTPKGKDNPSVVVNTTEAEVKFLTVTLPGRALAVHPGPQAPVSAVWKAPVSTRVKISARLHDADGKCGNGIEWALRLGARTLGSGTMDNGGSAAFPETELDVAAGDLVRLVVSPRGEYTCDSTQVDFVVRAADRDWDLRRALLAAADEGFTICEGDGERFSGETKDPALEQRRAELAAQLTPPPMCQGLQDGGVPGSPYAGFHEARLHVRGRHDRLGEVVPRRFPRLLADGAPPIEGSGREALARWVASPENPLTARVMVNRIWQHHFGGAGIVRTANNFGKLGEPPTHPELLDWLARRFIEEGWSVKAMHRLICLSATYQQSCTGSDVENRNFSRQNRRKLTAEELRDALLLAAGRLDRTRGGLSVNDLNTPRRTLYLTTVRSDRTSYQMLFDGADPTSIVEQRTDSVVAPQALWLLNHPFVRAQSAALAQRLPEQDRLAWLTRELFSRLPTAAERALVGETPVWERVCHALLCSNEFAYVD
jgi:hypothetical protein